MLSSFTFLTFIKYGQNYTLVQFPRRFKGRDVPIMNIHLNVWRKKMSKLDHRNIKVKVFNDEFHQILVFSEYRQISAFRKLEISWQWTVMKKKNE